MTYWQAKDRPLWEALKEARRKAEEAKKPPKPSWTELMARPPWEWRVPWTGETVEEAGREIARTALPLIGKGVEYGLYPFTEVGIARRATGQPWWMPTISPPPAEYYTEEARRARLPGGEEYERFRQLSWAEQIGYEAPAWAMAAALPGAAGISERLLAGGRVARPAGMALEATGVPLLERTTALVVRQTVGRVGTRLFDKATVWATRQELRNAATRAGVELPKATEQELVRRYQQAFANHLERELGNWTTTRGVELSDPIVEKTVDYFVRRASPKWASDRMITALGTGKVTPALIESAAVTVAQEAIRPLPAVLDDFAKPPVVPKAEVGMPEAGLQRGMFGIDKEVRPVGKGEITQPTLEDWGKLQRVLRGEAPTLPEPKIEVPSQFRFDVSALARRTAEINALLSKPGRLPAGEGTRSLLRIEQAQLSARREIVASTATAEDLPMLAERVANTVEAIENELGLRGMPYHGGEPAGFAQWDTKQLNAIWVEYKQFQAALEGGEFLPIEPRISLSDQIKDVYKNVQVEVDAWLASLKGMRGEEATTGRQTLRILEKELVNLDKMITSARGISTAPTESTLRQHIMAVGAFKGLPKTQMTAIFKRVTGKTRLTLMSIPQLEDTLKAVRGARPVNIRGKRVIRLQTEGTIQSLKSELIAQGKLSEEGYKNIMRYLRLPTDRFESANLFIGEAEGRQLARMMNYEAEIGLVEHDIKVTEALKKHPKIASEIDKIKVRQGKETQVFIDGKPVTVSPGWDMRYYMEWLQLRTGGRFRDVWQRARDVRLVNRHTERELQRRIDESSPEVTNISKDEVALKRVSDYIASKHKLEGVKYPMAITPEEIKVASTIEDILFGFRNDVRFWRFKDSYDRHEGNIDRILEDIPDAPREAIRQAIRTYESKGADTLRTFLDTQEWGVIKTGYEPHLVVHPRLRLYRAKMTTLGKGHLKVREGVEMLEQDKNILQRTNSYIRQILNLNLQPYLREIDKLLAENAGKLAKPGEVANVLSTAMNEMKGYSESGGILAQWMARATGQAYRAIFLRPVLSYRNLHQNLAYYPDRTDLINPINKALNNQELKYFSIFIDQSRTMGYEWLLKGEKPLPGMGRLSKLVDRISFYHLSDKVNRIWANWASLNRSKRALAQFQKDGDVGKFIRNSGADFLSTSQRKQALEMLSLDEYAYGAETGLEAVSGGEASARHISQEVVQNVHYLYDRFQRAALEMGALGRSLGSLLVFPRSTAQRMYRIVLQANPWGKASNREMVAAWKWLVTELAFCMLAGYTFLLVTGKKRHPYNPLNVLQWQPGGLAIGALEEIGDVIGDVMRSVQGDMDAIMRLPADLTRAGDMFIPFYDPIINLLETVLDQKYLDRLGIRKVISIFREKYEPTEEFYEAERSAKAKWQHAIFGGEPEEPKAEVPSLWGVEESVPVERGMGRISPERFQEIIREAVPEGIPPVEYMPPQPTGAGRISPERFRELIGR